MGTFSLKRQYCADEGNSQNIKIKKFSVFFFLPVHRQKTEDRDLTQTGNQNETFILPVGGINLVHALFCR